MDKTGSDTIRKVEPKSIRFSFRVALTKALQSTDKPLRGLLVGVLDRWAENPETTGMSYDCEDDLNGS